MTYQTFTGKLVKSPQRRLKEWLLSYCCCCCRKKYFGSSENFNTVQIRPRIVVEDDSDSETPEEIVELKETVLHRRSCRRGLVIGGESGTVFDYFLLELLCDC